MDFSSARTKMVDNQIRTTDVTSHSVLSAFLTVPRENFVGERFRTLAYIDSDIEIAAGRYLMEPSPLAKLLQLGGFTKADRVLEIGAGSGYVTALLAGIAGSVVGVEKDATLAALASENLAGTGNAEIVTGAHEKGCPAKGPYDAIFINGSVDEIPDALFSQLRDGGRLVGVIGRGHSSSAMVFIREGGTQSGRFAFNTSVKPLPGFEKAAEFVF